MKFTIRNEMETDYPFIQKIYEQGIATNLATFQMQSPTYEEWDAIHHSFCRFVALDEEQVIGFALLSPTSARPAFRGVAELSVYIHNNYKGKGVGSMLINHIIEQSEQNGIWTLYSSIMSDNEPSIALHKKCGFREIGYREKIAQDCNGVWRDTIIMERRSQKGLYK
ncbi:N-acetyltransferase family protein [Paludicola sp. MB14-C6]|uniref:GNAT family N-acetyltransferase n=1 Tax=Paludihabitans sp. MB14-C6 TaxID=3070656 RepID=UPI0027DC08BB|nr:GNAT family N-acetyltransferase [Paludicola sp. MB14-C6]WMJ22537.1 N-acetyltransferase family protein [Paludicola sp. MB14-C6]